MEGKVLPPPDNFLLMLLNPKSVKYLRLSDNLAIVDNLVIEKDGQMNWLSTRVNP